MKEKTYGYIRVSTRDQNEDRQLLAMKAFGVSAGNIICDKQSGKDFQRPGYRQLLKKMKPGDTLVIKSIDRLGRNYHEILEQWRMLTRTKRIAIVVLDMPLLDTRQGQDLTGTLIADIVLQLLSYVAEAERQAIRQRQQEGIAAAKMRGVRFGRPPMPKPEQYRAVYDAWLRGELSGRAAARSLGISHTSFRRWARQTAQTEPQDGEASRRKPTES